MTCKNGGTCVPFSLNEPSCNIGQISSTCCQCKRWKTMIAKKKKKTDHVSRSTGFYWPTLWTRFVLIWMKIRKKIVKCFFFVEVDYCSSDPCRGNGRCLSDQSGYRCECFEGYIGENCNGNPFVLLPVIVFYC